MASIIKRLDKQTGVIYVYESESYWDKEKKQPRSKRKLIGKIDGQTGEIVPTGGRKGRKKKKLRQIPPTACADGAKNFRKLLFLFPSGSFFLWLWRKHFFQILSGI